MGRKPSKRNEMLIRNQWNLTIQLLIIIGTYRRKYIYSIVEMNIIIYVRGSFRWR